MTAPVAFDKVNPVQNKETFQLPPLILHPFADPSGPHKLVESSHASLVLQGLLPAGEANNFDLERKLLDGRLSELRMLFYVGRDVKRWIDQCMDAIARSEEASRSGIQAQSFASLLIQHTPPAVAEKLRNWGVNDFKTIFSRALGINAVFGAAPSAETLSDEFVRNYFRYADQLFFAYQSQLVYVQLDPAYYPFDLYSSSEYARMLERSWE